MPHGGPTLVLHRRYGRRGPVVFGNAAPEYPYHNHGQKSEEGFEEGAVYSARRATTYVHADYVLKDLADGKQE